MPFKTILWFDLHQLFNDDNLYKMKIISRSSISSSIMISSISLSISFSLSYPRYVWLAIIWRSVWLNRYWSLSKDLCARCPILVFSFYVILIKDSSKNSFFWKLGKVEEQNLSLNIITYFQVRWLLLEVRNNIATVINKYIFIRPGFFWF